MIKNKNRKKNKDKILKKLNKLSNNFPKCLSPLSKNGEVIKRLT